MLRGKERFWTVADNVNTKRRIPHQGDEPLMSRGLSKCSLGTKVNHPVVNLPRAFQSSWFHNLLFPAKTSNITIAKYNYMIKISMRLRLLINIRAPTIPYS